MDVVGLAFTVFGHLLASVLYIWRRIPFSTSNDAVDRSSILENKDQLRQLWERRIMADDQSQASHEPQVSTTEKVEVNENHTKKLIVENGTSNACKLSEGSDTKDPKSQDSDVVDGASTGHKDTDPISTPVTASQGLTNGNEPTIETIQTNHVTKHESADDVEHSSKKEDVSEKNESDTSFTNANGSLSDDQKVDKIDNQNAGETDDLEQSEIADTSDVNDSGIVVTDREREEDDAERNIPNAEFTDCSTKAKQVVEDTEEPLDEPNTEAYYTSSFTFVCQKSHEENEEGEESLEKLDADEVNMEVFEANTVEEGSSGFSETPDPVEDADNAPEIPESSSCDASHSECFKTTENDEVTEEVCNSERSEECTLTGDFQEANDEAGNIITEVQSANEKNESEIDAEVYDNKLNNNSAEQDLMIRIESAISDSDGELKAEKAERPSHFVRLKRTGVQKTERPYDSGTTESKIAMEIREMREREEELRLMRERMQSPEANTSSTSSPMLSPTASKPKTLPPQDNSVSPETGPGYRVSTVFGHKSSPVQSPVEEEKKTYRSFSKESPVEKEIRIARNREEELRKEKGLPPREDDSYIKPSQVKSAQVRVFGKINASNTTKELATTKIQQEIEEQTLREMALREKGHIQTISQERTDSKVAKLKDLDLSVPECTSPAPSNGHVSPLSDRSSKRSTPSPTGSSHGSFPPVSPRPVVNQGKGISMQKFIASKGKETTFIASRNGPSHPEQNADASRSNPVMRKAKRTVSVESKIQQEILEMKRREEELRRMHNSSTDQSLLTTGENGTDHAEEVNDVPEYTNGQEINGNDDSGPSSNNLIAQWEQRIQKAEGKA